MKYLVLYAVIAAALLLSGCASHDSTYSVTRKDTSADTSSAADSSSYEETETSAAEDTSDTKPSEDSAKKASSKAKSDSSTAESKTPPADKVVSADWAELFGVETDDSFVPYVLEFSGPITVPIEEEADIVRHDLPYDPEDYTDCLPQIRSLIDDIDSDHTLTSFGSRKPSEAAMAALSAEIDAVTADGGHVSLVMADLDKQSGVSYCSGKIMCTQSTIKGVYVAAVLEQYYDAMELNGQYMHDAIVYSDNNAYMALYTIYGKDPLLCWCEEAGVGEFFTDMPYPQNACAKDMIKMWTLVYRFLNSGSQDAWFGDYYTFSAYSATGSELGHEFTVQSKSGWEDGLDINGYIAPVFFDGDPYNDETATNDCGIVYTPEGPYIFVLYTDIPFDPDRLHSIVRRLREVQLSYSQEAQEDDEQTDADSGMSEDSSEEDSKPAEPTDDSEHGEDKTEEISSADDTPSETSADSEKE